jgi:hypothetical protein
MPDPNSRLESLCAEYDEWRDRADEANRELDRIKTGIKAELAALLPDESRVVVRSAYLAQPLRLRAEDTWRFDVKRFKEEDPIGYVKYAVKGTRRVLERVT